MHRSSTDVPPGLNGVRVTTTTIGAVDGDAGSFHYRGHDATALAEACSFEAVAHLVLRGSLPTERREAEFEVELAARRALPAEAVAALRTLSSSTTDAATLLRTGLSMTGMGLPVAPLLDSTAAARGELALALTARFPTVIAALHRFGSGLEPIAPRHDLGHAANYLWMLHGEEPGDEAARALEQYLILTIDHGFNASTFAARVIASTGTDLVGVVTGALAALIGPLHGGAPSRALDALDAIGTPANAAAWTRRELRAGHRIMGFGHAVYRAPDPRSTLLGRVAEGLGGDDVDRARAVEREILRVLAEHKPDRALPSNVEFYAGVVMERCGVPRSLFTSTFALSRLVGWCAHALEQAAEGKLIRPSSVYVGSTGAPGSNRSCGP